MNLDPENTLKNPISAISFRRPQLKDLDSILDLAAEHRKLLEKHQPIFWKDAQNSRESQSSYFTELLTTNTRGAHLCLAERDNNVVGFAISFLSPAPGVYDPGGTVCFIDDFAIAKNQEWSEIGPLLLREIEQLAKNEGAVLSVVVCSHLDEQKRKMLKEQSFSIGSEWWISSRLK